MIVSDPKLSLTKSQFWLWNLRKSVMSAMRLSVLAVVLAPNVFVVGGNKVSPSPRGPAPPLQQQCSTLEHAVSRVRGGSCEPVEATTGALFEELKGWHPVLLGFLGTSFGWFMTALGSAAVVVHHLGLPETAYRKLLDFMLGVSGGVMTAASYWSLLAPALEFAEAQGWNGHEYIPVALGFLSGGILLQLTERILEALQGSMEELDLYKGVAQGSEQGSADKKAKFRRLMLLIFAITIHNFPEGMAVGVAFGAVGSSPGVG
jgi:hypothetical protein